MWLTKDRNRWNGEERHCLTFEDIAGTLQTNALAVQSDDDSILALFSFGLVNLRPNKNSTVLDGPLCSQIIRNMLNN